MNTPLVVQVIKPVKYVLSSLFIKDLLVMTQVFEQTNHIYNKLLHSINHMKNHSSLLLLTLLHLAALFVTGTKIK